MFGVLNHSRQLFVKEYNRICKSCEAYLIFLYLSNNLNKEEQEQYPMPSKLRHFSSRFLGCLPTLQVQASYRQCVLPSRPLGIISGIQMTIDVSVHKSESK